MLGDLGAVVNSPRISVSPIFAFTFTALLTIQTSIKLRSIVINLGLLGDGGVFRSRFCPVISQVEATWPGMATIKAIEARSVHQIQSGQVIVDLCSVAKELVENSLDAGATTVEVRFKNHGLDSIEVQDNGSGIAPANYDTLALKHYTSKLSSFDDLSSLQTFGFRGEALSSLCALSKFSIVTAQADEAPKGKRLDFDSLGKLKSVTVVAAQRGTTASVENLFESLPVRRKELTKNIKREYNKVLGLLQAYACIGVNVKFTVKNTMPKSKSMMVFSTKGNATTRENIANVYGAKTLSALVALDLELDYQPTLTQMARKDKHTNIRVRGHISKPVFGEGRQTPDRQMFFVNGRPCGLPQIAKAINEVYKAFNVSQSPFIFADLQMDTNAYDVNVSPDKRTILIHDSASLVESLKTALNEMFDQQEQTVPSSQLVTSKLPAFQKLSFLRQPSSSSPESASRQTSFSDHPAPVDDDEDGDRFDEDESRTASVMDDLQKFSRTAKDVGSSEILQPEKVDLRERSAEKALEEIVRQHTPTNESLEEDDDQEVIETEEILQQSEEEEEASQFDPVKLHVSDFNARMAEAQLRLNYQATIRQDDGRQTEEIKAMVPAKTGLEKGPVQNAFDRMRPKRLSEEIATFTIGDKTFTTVLGSQSPKSLEKRDIPGSLRSAISPQRRTKSPGAFQFSQKLRRFGAQGSNIPDEEEGDSDAQSDAELVDADSETTEDFPAEHESDLDQQSVGNEDLAEDELEAAPDTEGESDADYIDDEEKKRIEEAKVAELIQAAEASSTVPTKENLKREMKALAGGRAKESTTNLLATIEFSISSISSQMRQYVRPVDSSMSRRSSQVDGKDNDVEDPETRLSLTVSKPDFAQMRIVGQFNLGFILGVRPAKKSAVTKTQVTQDELFIIDQHASDEKYNFERLQAETIVGNQRLVRPVILDLTAVEEEIVLENNEALEKNGFLVEIDTSGDKMVGQRCRLVSLPLSKEVVFGMKDLEELIQLLADTPMGGSSDIPRPSKVRKMFAMRACRSSIMIGKTLSKRQMQKVVANMGTIDKPWNCPHGRPTMRHLCSLDTLQPWCEGDDEGAGAASLGVALHRFVTEY
ncbi:hypothetical protein AYO21_07202 [Fonsecaea monophora]|uniref:DNA mismatch repair protein PMS1 n=1 Tax=Fonsecaea monophora TaxID=254056 RepID=A0A177F5A9_9EURO|nr:hypothetical protein AYO21_07202 [Fonsecaea monophora]KAH0843520.1 putative DNA mismatch repair protein (Pms1) [Fonsecaea pedrosoi]OAG38542.1 hypothetical protein AYO21_07202 [Fonsecaea monophora]